MGKGNRIQKDRTEVVTGQQYIVTTYTAGSTTNNFQILRPNLVDRLTTLSDAYNLYRFTKLRIEKPPCDELNGGTAMPGNIVQGIAVVMDTVDTYPNTVNVLSEFPFMMVFAPTAMTVPRFLDVPRRALLGGAANKWWKTKSSSTTEDWTENQGLILFQDESASGTSTAAYVLNYEIEFSDPCPIVDTPESLEARLEKLRMRSVQRHVSPHVCYGKTAGSVLALQDSCLTGKPH